MLSPADFIFNDFSSPPVYYLETQHFPEENASNSTHFTRAFKKPIAKVNNPHFGSGAHAVDLDGVTFSNVLREYLLTSEVNSSGFKLDDIYFPGVRFLSDGVVVFERPPSYQVVDIDNDYRDNIRDQTTTSQYYIPLPWQVYVCTFNPSDMRLVAVRMFFAQSSLTHPDQTVYCPPMFNFYSNGNLCRPFFASIDDIEKYPQTISGVIASAFDWVWNSGFNFDITENIAQFLSSKKFEEFAPWAELSVPKSIEFLRTNPIYGLPRLTHKSYFDALFKCWESVPLDEVSSIVWSNYTNAEFYYIEQSNASQQFLNEYVFENDIILCEYDHDGDDEDYDHSYDDCISEESVRDSHHYQVALSKANFITEKSIATAVAAVTSDPILAQLSQKVPTAISFRKTFANIYEKFLS